MEKKLEFTESAKNQIEKITKSDKKKYFRIAVQGGGCSGFSYFLEFAEEAKVNDRHLDSFGVTLLVDQKSYLYLMGTEVDYVDGLEGAGFKFQNPNARRTCGCGESFSV